MELPLCCIHVALESRKLCQCKGGLGWLPWGAKQAPVSSNQEGTREQYLIPEPNHGHNPTLRQAGYDIEISGSASLWRHGESVLWLCLFSSWLPKGFRTQISWQQWFRNNAFSRILQIQRTAGAKLFLSYCVHVVLVNKIDNHFMTAWVFDPSSLSFLWPYCLGYCSVLSGPFNAWKRWRQNTAAL